MTGERFNPFQPNQLPPELTDFLSRHTYAAILHGSNLGTILVAKVPTPDLRTLGGRHPIGVAHQLYDHPESPVIRMVTTIHDRPQSPLTLETFINVGDLDQRSDYDVLSRQQELLMLFYDEAVQHQLTKRTRNTHQTGMAQILARADALLHQIPPEYRNFDMAKADVMGATDM